MGRFRFPLCFVMAPWTAVLAQSYEIECPTCRAPLELSRYTRIVVGVGGIAGAMIAAYLTPGAFSGGFWVTRMVGAILGYGVASAVCAGLAGDLDVRPTDAPTAFPHPAK